MKKIAAMQDKLGKELKKEEESIWATFSTYGAIKKFDKNSHKCKRRWVAISRAVATIWGKWKKAKHRREEKNVESAADIVLAQDGRVRALMRWETDSILTSKIERIVGRDKVAFKMLAPRIRKLERASARKWKVVQDYMIQYTKAHNELAKKERV